jgi:polar amino acid transport system substrate-binding protein
VRPDRRHRSGHHLPDDLTANASKCAATGKKPYTVQYFSDAAAIWRGLTNGRIDVYFGPTLSLEYDAAHVANVKFLSQVSSTPVGFVTAKGSPLAKLLSEAVNELIQDGEYQKIPDKWSITGNGITSSALNPKPALQAATLEELVLAKGGCRRAG